MKWLRIAAMAIGTLFIAVIIVAVILYALGSAKLGKTYAFDVQALPMMTDSLSLAEGERLAKVYGCFDCHGDRLQGDVMLDDPLIGRIPSAHIATGEGSRTAEYGVEDWLRTLRHAVGPDGKPLVIMPSEYYTKLTEQDLMRMISYLVQAPAVDAVQPTRKVGPLARVFIGAGLFRLGVDLIDHEAPPPVVTPAVNAEYGEYLSLICSACHGDKLDGNADPEFGGPTLRSDGALASYAEDDLFRVLREGRTPDGRLLDPERMPWTSLGFMNDDEIRAVWLYIRSLPAVMAAQ